MATRIPPRVSHSKEEPLVGGTWRKFQKLIPSPGTLPSSPLPPSTPAPGFVDVAADGCKLTLSSPQPLPFQKFCILPANTPRLPVPISPSPTSCPLATWRGRRPFENILRLKAVNTLLILPLTLSLFLCVSLSHTHNCIYNFKGWQFPET